MNIKQFYTKYNHYIFLSLSAILYLMLLWLYSLFFAGCSDHNRSLTQQKQQASILLADTVPIQTDRLKALPPPQIDAYRIVKRSDNQLIDTAINSVNCRYGNTDERQSPSFYISIIDCAGDIGAKKTEAVRLRLRGEPLYVKENYSNRLIELDGAKGYASKQIKEDATDYGVSLIIKGRFLLNARSRHLDNEQLQAILKKSNLIQTLQAI